MSAPRPDVSVVVVSYEVRDLLHRCLETLDAQRGVTAEVLVVDNASRDGSADLVAREFPRARLFRNAENAGFARANNQALREARGGVLLLLNPDTEMPPDGLRGLLDVFARWPRAGAVGLALLNPDGSPQPACHAFPGLFNIALEAVGAHRAAWRLGLGSPTWAPVPRGGEGPVDWVGGACMALSRAAYEAVGGLDERLFMYGEEMDWSWRARRRGFATVFSESVRVVHHGGASGVGLRGPLFVKNLEARLHFLREHRGAWRARVARELMVAGCALRLAYWRRRARTPAGRGDAWTREQVERFEAVLAWRAERRA